MAEDGAFFWDSPILIPSAALIGLSISLGKQDRSSPRFGGTHRDQGTERSRRQVVHHGLKRELLGVMRENAAADHDALGKILNLEITDSTVGRVLDRGFETNDEA